MVGVGQRTLSYLATQFSLAHSTADLRVRSVVLVVFWPHEGVMIHYGVSFQRVPAFLATRIQCDVFIFELEKGDYVLKESLSHVEESSKSSCIKCMLKIRCMGFKIFLHQNKL